eukprot:2594881-Rhodomonas_salina.1
MSCKCCCSVTLCLTSLLRSCFSAGGSRLSTSTSSACPSSCRRCQKGRSAAGSWPDSLSSMSCPCALTNACSEHHPLTMRGTSESSSRTVATCHSSINISVSPSSSAESSCPVNSATPVSMLTSYRIRSTHQPRPVGLGAQSRSSVRVVIGIRSGCAFTMAWHISVSVIPPMLRYPVRNSHLYISLFGS